MKRLFLLFFMACATHDDEPAAPPPPPSPVSTSPTVAPGVRITELAGGLVRVQTTDRWGNAIDTTYESADYLRSSLPSLALSVSPDDLAKLRAYGEGTPPK
jgi:hypothetical protein